MDRVRSETSCIMESNNCILYALCSFYSLIVLRNLTAPQLEIFRKLERTSKTVIKCNADIKFSNLVVKESNIHVPSYMILHKS